MAEFDNKLKVTISGTVEGEGEVFEEYEGTGAIVFAQDDRCISGMVSGGWSIKDVSALISELRRLFGSEMFNAALALFVAEEMAEMLAKAAEDADSEDDGENAETEES